MKTVQAIRTRALSICNVLHKISPKIMQNDGRECEVSVLQKNTLKSFLYFSAKFCIQGSRLEMLSLFFLLDYIDVDCVDGNDLLLRSCVLVCLILIWLS